MVDATVGPDRIDTEKDLGTGDDALFAFWMGQERIADKEEKRWVNWGRAIVKRYRDERPQQVTLIHRFNILWSNVQTLLPTLYARTPKPDVQRRYKDQDDVGRLASILLERCLSFSLDPAHSDFDLVMSACVLDRLLPGRGVPRVLYVPHFGDTIEEGQQTVGDGNGVSFEETQAEATLVDNTGDAGSDPLREVVDEEVKVAYVYWEDYREGAARTWAEVPWVRYKAFMTRDELINRFGKKKGNRVNLDFPSKNSRQNMETGKEDVPPDIYRKAIVHEYWDKTKKEVVWLAPGTPDLILDQVDDPLGLPNFFPNPDPLLGTTTNDTRIPVPDYVQYKDQAEELDKITSRIDRLTRALKVSGIYPGEQKQTLQQLIDEGTENRLIPVNDWVAFADKGGLGQFIQFMPIKDIAGVLIQLYDARDRVKSILYEITGIGDIMRGETQPTETATAQQLKTNFVTRRVVPQQRAVARLARDTIRLMAAIIAGHFSAETISRITGYPQLQPVPQLPPAPPQWIPAPMQQAPAAPPVAPPPASPANDTTPPPQAMQGLPEGGTRTFANGQRWTVRNGQPARVA